MARANEQSNGGDEVRDRARRHMEKFAGKGKGAKLYGKPRKIADELPPPKPGAPPAAPPPTLMGKRR
jgi:hypothetical protein